jgi:aminopeptidase N
MRATEITRAGSAERARLLRVDSCDVALDFTRGAEIFGSVSRIRFDCAEPGQASHVDLVARAVHEITLNGVPLDVRVWEDGRIALPALAGRNELRVVADCSYAASGTGMHRSDEGGTYIYGKLAQAYARTAYACFDQPDLKAEFTFEVKAPEHWTVMSNQPLYSSERCDAGSRTFRFLRTPRLPSFTTTVVAGDYHVERESYNGIPLELACRAELAADLDARSLFELTGKGLDFYTSWLGAPYPYAKYGQVFVPELSCLASEDAGCVLVSEQLLFRSGPEAMDQLRANVVLHEMAHMWFGDLVTQEWWDDLWLSESFAEFCGSHAQVRLGLHPQAWSVFSVEEKIQGFAQDQLPSAHPVASGAATVSEAIANFDGISYAKGASVLRQLAAYVGEENFTAGLRDYIARHAYGNATLADLIAAMAASSGKDLTEWSRAWLETAGPSRLRCEFRGEFTIVQEGAVLRPHHVAIGWYERVDGGLARTRRLEVDVTGERTQVPGLAGLSRPDLVLLNDDDTGYVIVRFDPRSLDTVLSSVGELPDPAARAVCWNSVIDMVRQGELAASAFAAMLAGAMRSEPSDSMLHALHGQAEQILTRLGRWPSPEDGKRLLAEAAVQALRSADGRQRTWIQLLSWTATTADQLDLISGWMDNPALDSELRWSLLQRLVVAGRADDASIDAELARNPSDASRRHAAACRAAVPDARHKEDAWRLLTQGSPGPETVSAVARGLMQPEHAGLLAPYAERYLAEIPQIFATRGGHMRVLLANVLFPYPAVSPEVVAMIAEFLARPRDPDLMRIVSDHLARASGALGSGR